MDADWDEILQMPVELALAAGPRVALAGIFTFLLLKIWIVAGLFLLAAFGVLAAWHGKEPW